MTPDQLIEQAKLAIRWAESVKAGTPIGIEVRSQSASEWHIPRGDGPTWNFRDCEYREKPRPREYWIVICGKSMDAESVIHACKGNADHFAHLYGGKVVHMREVCE